MKTTTNRERVRQWRREQQAKGGRSLSVFLDKETTETFNALSGHYRMDNTALLKKAIRWLHDITCNKSADRETSLGAPFSTDQVLSVAGSGIIATDHAGHIVFINRVALKIMELTRDRAQGRLIYDLLPKTGRWVRKCLESGQPQPGRRILGQHLNLLVYVTPISAGDRLVGAVCDFQSIPEFEVIGTELESYKELNRQLTAILNASWESIWVCDGDGVVKTINKSCERLLDVKAADVVGKNVEKLVRDGFMDRSSTSEVLESKRQVHMLQYITKTKKHLLVTSTPVLDSDGNISLVVTNERDMTGLNNLRAQLQAARAETRKIKDQLTELNLMELKQQDIIAESPQMRNVLKIAFKLASLDISNILVMGESGTGKGLLAKFLHENSPRKKAPFIQINCAALPESLLEAELFGYEKGAFTGARREGKPGLFELAKEGTLFLDEIGELPMAVQAKLLKCLDEFEIQRLGGLRPIKITCVVITASNRNLPEQVKLKRFREDLFFRLNSFTIEIPPLRERRDDILPLTHFYLQKYNQRFESRKRLSVRAMEQLQIHGFPGNVRELKNMIKHAVVMHDHRIINYLSGALATPDCPAVDDSSPPLPQPPPKDLKEAMAAYERILLKEALSHCTTTRQLASRLGVSQPSIVRKLKTYGLTL
jgi:TyrR family helix-turn-helix protein/PAS domain S-box-containing protein